MRAMRRVGTERLRVITYMRASPLSRADFASNEFWDQSNEATIGWLRHAEMKHVRPAKPKPKPRRTCERSRPTPAG